MDKDFDRYLAMVDPLIVQTQVVEALNEDADLADKVEEELANEFMRQLEEPAYQRQVIKSSQINHKKMYHILDLCMLEIIATKKRPIYHYRNSIMKNIPLIDLFDQIVHN